jgi:hypothetical protein
LKLESIFLLRLNDAPDWHDGGGDIHIVVGLKTNVSVSGRSDPIENELTLMVAEGPLNDSDSITSG